MNLKKLGDINYSHLKVDSDLKNDEVNEPLLQDLQKAGQTADVVLTITTAKSDHDVYTTTGNKSRHGFQTAVDIAKLDGKGSNGATSSNLGSKEFREKGNKVKDALVAMGYTWNTEKGNPKAVLWLTNTGGNHYNHLHVSNKTGAESELDLSKLDKKDDSKKSTGSDDNKLASNDKEKTPDVFEKLSKKEKDELFSNIMSFIASESKKGDNDKILSETLRIKDLMK